MPTTDPAPHPRWTASTSLLARLRTVARTQWLAVAGALAAIATALTGFPVEGTVSAA